MFENDLRLGEVLGLTSDNITSDIIEGKKKFFVYLRNRVSENKYTNVINLRGNK